MNGFVVEGKPGRWIIRPLTPTGRPITDDNDEVRTWATKAEATKYKRELEGQLTAVPRERSEGFRRKNLTGRRGRAILKTTQGPPRQGS